MVDEKTESLRKSEENYRRLFETMAQGVVCQDADGKITFTNPAAERILGLTPDQVQGRTSADPRWKAIHEDGSAFNTDTHPAMVALRTGRKASDVIMGVYNPLEKEYRWINTNSVPEFREGEDKPYQVYTTFDDITERKQAEELVKAERDLGIALSKAASFEEVMNLCLESSIRVSGLDCGGVYLVNEHNGDIDLVIQKGLPQVFLKRVSHYSADSDSVRIIMKGEPIYTRHRELGVKLDETRRGEGLKAIAVLPIRYQDRVVACLNVASHTLDDVPGFSRTALETIASHIGASIMQAKREEEIRRLRNYLSNIIDSMPSVLVGVDTEGKVTQWNRQAELETGIQADAAVHRKLEEVFPHLAMEMEKIHTAMQERQTQRDPKKPYRENGETRYQDVTVYPLVTNGVEGAVIRIDDVTRHVRIEEMMIQSGKMLSVGGLAAGMAHEINNPLAGMMQNASVLINRLTEDLPVNLRAAAECGTDMAAIRAFMEKRSVIKLLKLIHESGCRAANIVRDMLNFARKSESKTAPNDLCQLLDRTVALAENDYDLKRKFDFRQIEIVRQYEPRMPAVSCEAGKIQQVFLNLLKNGAEAMSEDRGKPGRQQGKKEKPGFVLRVSREGDMARIEIEDNGPGMDEATRKRIFEPFFTTKGVGTGTGLGLSVSYFIITENHGGTMRVESTPAKGTKFIIRLPIEGRTRA